MWCETAGIAADKFDGDSATVTQDVAALEVLARVPRSLTLSAPRRKDWPEAWQQLQRRRPWKKAIHCCHTTCAVLAWWRLGYVER